MTVIWYLMVLGCCLAIVHYVGVAKLKHNKHNNYKEVNCIQAKSKYI